MLEESKYTLPCSRGMSSSRARRPATSFVFGILAVALVFGVEDRRWGTVTSEGSGSKLQRGWEGEVLPTDPSAKIVPSLVTGGRQMYRAFS